MNILSLNMRGWGDRGKRRQLVALINSRSFDFICVQETKREVMVEQEVGMLWGNRSFQWIHQPSRGSSGGIL